MKTIFKFPAWMFVMLSITLLHLTARGQTVDLFDLRPSYSASATPNVYNSNIVVDATASQAGTVYYVIYRNKPATTPSSSLIVQYVDGTVTPPASVKAKGTISAPTAGQKYSVTVSAMTPHKNYYAYAVLKNSSGTVGTAVKSASDIRLMEAKYVANNYFYAEYNSHEYLTSTAKYPLMVFLHGNNEKGTTVEELIEPTKYGPPMHVQECDTTTTTIPELTKFIIVTPQSDTDFYVDGTGWSASKLTTFVNAVMNGNSRIDRNRIYITGLSMGGIGTFRYAIANPTIPAAIVPISGDGDDSKACTIAHIPMWLFHDDPDDVVSVSNSKSMFNAVKACSTYTDNANLTLRRSFNRNWSCAVDSMHSVWGTAYGTSHQTPYPDVTCVAGASGTSGRDITETHSNMPAGSTVYKWLLKFSKGPTANAGPDKSITLPTNTVNITGTGSPAGVTFAWSQVNGGPNNAQLSNQNTATLTASNLIEGTYTFRLTVTDPATSSTGQDDVIVTVEPAAGGDRVIKIDFRGGPPVTGNTAWNDFLDGADAGDVFANLKDDQGVATGYSITVVDGFQGTNANGSNSTTGVYPASVMQTAWYTSTTAAKLTISGLNNSKKYTLRFFGSRVDNSSSTQRNTDYTIVGGPVVTLNALNNSLNTEQVTDISPTSQSITFTVKGAVGANGGFGYLNAMEIIEQAEVQESQTFQIDLRGSGSATDPAWHDFAAFPSAGAELANLKNTEGVASTYKLTVASNAFTNSNANGSTSTSGIYPASVMQTAWYTASTTVGASMTLSGLNNNSTYTFVFFGSRNDATTINRDTYYTIGSTTTPPLNASNNSTNTVSIDDVSPTNGSITFNVKGGPSASGGFGYLNALVIIENSSSSSLMAQSGQSQMADEKEPVDIYPAPFTNRLTVAFTEDLPGHVSVTIKDIRGQVYYHSRNLDGVAGTKIEIETEGSRIPRGLTIVEVKSSGGYHKTFKVFKE